MSYRTGYSGDDADDRPARFKDVCDEINTRINTGEFRWGPAPGHPADPDEKYVKDLGIDAVAWKVFGDRREGNLIALGQCACGGNWRSKDSDINLENLRTYWFRPLSAAPAIRFFAIPFHVPNRIDFAHVNTTHGLALHRVRLTRISDANEASRDSILDGRQDDYKELIKCAIPDFRAV